MKPLVISRLSLGMGDRFAHQAVAQLHACQMAAEQGATVTELNLESQFRCNGSDGYLAWLDNTLQIRETANDRLDTNDYDFRIFDNPSDLHELIQLKNKDKNKARMVAGYCWKWISKKQPNLKDIVIGDYKATWNLVEDGQGWIIKPESVSEVGCIHTSQGLEVDYVGVIVGPDLVVRDGCVITDHKERASEDKSIHGWKKLYKENPDGTVTRLDSITKNTYRTLMTRGQKGCYVYFTDDETRRFFESLIDVTVAAEEIHIPIIDDCEEVSDFPFRRLPQEDVSPYENCVPLYDLKIAAGQFSEEQQSSEIDWVELPDFIQPRPGLFVAQVLGESMNRRIPNGSWCLFNMQPAGTRQGKAVLVQHREVTDVDNGGHFTVKVYESTKESLPDGSWRHSSIVLRPDTTTAGYNPIFLSGDKAEDLDVVAEFVAVLG